MMKLLRKWILALIIMFVVYLIGFSYIHLSNRISSLAPVLLTESLLKTGIQNESTTPTPKEPTTHLKTPKFHTIGENFRHTRKVAHSSQKPPPAYGFEAMIIEDMHASFNQDFPKNSACPYVGLRKPQAKSTVTVHSQEPICSLRLETDNDCNESVKYYGKPGEIKEVMCNVSKVVKMCRIVLQKDIESFDVVCDLSHCGGESLRLGLLGSETGVVDNWTVILDIRRIGDLLRAHMLSSKFGSGFALLKCESRHIFQVLTLPKILKRSTTRRKRNKVNFNIVVEDSVSRKHFFRTLLKTASTLRNIIYDRTIPATVLEFEKVQSYDTTTRTNLKRLFSGTKYLHSRSDNIGLEEFFSLFKEFGYRTLFQEDNCWYDKWGTIIDFRYRTGRVKDKETRDEIWKEFVDLLQNTKRSLSIDDYGVTFLSCSVYSYLRTTNVYDAENFPKVCFAGQHFSSFFLDYVGEYVKLNDNAESPFLAYTHLITSHERSGRRIVNDDIALSKLLREAAEMVNTITIFISDHGGKSTKFSSYTVQGRHEIFQPFMFMIIPHAVSKKLGPEVVNALFANQKRLVGLQDLGDALQTYVNPATPQLQRGLFRLIPLNRTCEQLELDSDVLCLCDKMDKSISNSSQDVSWAAEFALGSLNKIIHNQFITGLQQSKPELLTSDFYGYGACQRYIGLGVGLPRHRVAGDDEVLSFTLFVQPFDRKTREAFDIKVSFSVKQEMGMSLDKFTRASSFNEYEQCVDRNVNPKLCTCRTGRRNAFKWRQKFTSRKVASLRSFSLVPTGQILDHPCLTIYTRNRQNSLPGGKKQNAISTYEAFNACSHLMYNLTIDVKVARHTRVSCVFPNTVTIFPRTMTFLMTVSNEWKYGKFIPRFSFVKRKLRNSEKQERNEDQ
ncbi:uncharacterized protein LOC114524438 [Dendronephthya gigantea]|uniref:uncharacterized protein LOC114524438 n=1 Tax=Dendronephthya gigantea TaxID=151771 RepID=UPI00106956F1|nr:uncharacterized protein LOC114524438 [Dendronephthya gigantea]